MPDTIGEVFLDGAWHAVEPAGGRYRITGREGTLDADALSRLLARTPWRGKAAAAGCTPESRPVGRVLVHGTWRAVTEDGERYLVEGTAEPLSLVDLLRLQETHPFEAAAPPEPDFILREAPAAPVPPPPRDAAPPPPPVMPAVAPGTPAGPPAVPRSRPVGIAVLLASLALLAATAAWGVRSPQYSLWRLAAAADRGDWEAARGYVDAEAVAGYLIEQTVAQQEDGPYSDFATAFLYGMEPLLEEAVEGTLEELVESHPDYGGTHPSEAVGYLQPGDAAERAARQEAVGGSGLFDSRIQDVGVAGSTAEVRLLRPDGEELTLVMERRGSRWVITGAIMSEDLLEGVSDL